MNENPANGKYFTKQELLDKTKPDDLAGRAFIDMMHDHIAVAPLEALLIVVANRIAQADGGKLPCATVHFLADAAHAITGVCDTIIREHTIQHIDELFDNAKGGDTDIIEFLRRMFKDRQ